IVTLRAQTGVVFLTYRANADVTAIARRVTSSEPLYDFTADDGVRHAIWRAGEADSAAARAAFERIPALYIADGHHRVASAARARGELGGSAGVFIAVAFPDSDVQILPYNRIVKDLAGRTPDQFLDLVRSRFPVTPGHATPRRKGEVSMYLAGSWHVVDLSG